MQTLLKEVLIIFSFLCLVALAAVIVVNEPQKGAPQPATPIGQGTATTTPTSTPPVSSTPVEPGQPNPTPIPTPITTSPFLRYLTPTSGSVGTTVVIYGAGFLNTNTVLFGGGPVNNTTVSGNGSVLTFTVPSAVGADCKPNQACPMYERLITNGDYTVSVRNVNGTSNALSFTVTGGSNFNQPN